MKIYTATPINARPEPTFQQKYKAAQERIHELWGILRFNRITNPGDTLTSTFSINPIGTSEAEAMGRCVQAVMESDLVVFDRGWEHSKGCSVEYMTAKTYGKTILFHDAEAWDIELPERIRSIE